MLGKQAWRMLTKSDSLVARVYKARYFPKGTFFYAQDEQDPMIQPEMPVQLQEARVVGLIDQQTDVERIMRIPVSPDYNDTWYWHGDPKGIYSVKSGYRRIVGDYENQGEEFVNWLALWRLKIPPKWRMFLWRAICDILPTTTNLLIKRVDVSPYCAMCGISQEDTMHALVLCDFARNIWQQSNLTIPNIVTNIFHVWFEELQNVLDSDGMLYAASILYNIWRARNRAVWEACLPRPNPLIRAAAAAKDAWILACPTRVSAAGTAPTTAARRTADQARHVTDQETALVAEHSMPILRRCRVDAGYLHETGKATVGAVLFDVDGGYISAFNAPLPTCFSPLMAEALACKEVLSWLKDRGEQNIELYTDCLTLQHYLTTPTAAFRSYVGYAIDGCRQIATLFQYCSFNFIPRSDNYLAHALATTAYQQLAAMYWDTHPPDIISAFF
ncbi:PREDICTED: uncharacterized protein LOC109183669 [Ipomoea nil]|uniref:uncharacterized protein LOC109183669 n=1 Tax=Ipomoea nil TaxID=35883 RepID=UPI0009008D07|nr:PREDICTED: uncharacterized protein LOC109183669 [Ipomoea nil]